VSPHGVPLDLLDRLLIIRTMPYTVAEIVQILRIRADTEDIPVDEAAFARLGEIGNEATLRYACQLLTPANVLRRTNGKATVTQAEVDDIHALFYHAKSSARKLADNDTKYMH
jgi:RuvB-like protein 1 (pontin 52)